MCGWVEGIALLCASAGGAHLDALARPGSAALSRPLPDAGKQEAALHFDTAVVSMVDVADLQDHGQPAV